MVEGIPWQDVEYIVELGPGTGVFTEHIIRRARSDAQILLIEVEDSYLPPLIERFGSRTDIAHCSGNLLNQLVAERGWPRVDLIISGLPFNLPPTIRTPLFKALHSRSRTGTIIRCFTYFPPGMRKAYRGFQCRRHRMIWRNIPPMWIYEPKG